jgi:23S rRNA pseudouridine1911/1915/1917 synthase
LSAGDVVEVLKKPAPVHRGATVQALVVRHLDDDLVVVEKPSGINTVRHPAEREWKEERKQLSPTLQDLAQWAIAEKLSKPVRALQRLRIVHRLDKETSGLVVFARSVNAERMLGKQFHRHTVLRRYLAIVKGNFKPQTISSRLLRDRGDGRRGSSNASDTVGKEAITHITVEERIGEYCVLACILETGRTHQIRIHLAEAGYPVCGEPVYRKRPDGSEIPDDSRAPRLALHASELGFEHPADLKQLHWSMDMPLDLQGFLQHLRNKSK